MKIISLVVLILVGCRSVKKQSSQSVEARNHIESVASDSIVSEANTKEQVQKNTVSLSSINFKIIPGVNTEKRTYAIQDKNGNIVSGEINPTDTLVFSNDVVSIEAFEKMKELKEYYEHRSLSAEKRYNDLLVKQEKTVERKPQPFKWWLAGVIGIVIITLVIRFLRR